MCAAASTVPVPPPSSFGPKTGDVEPRFLEMVKLNFDRARAVANVDKDMFEIIKSCNSMLRVNFPLRRDDGSIEVRVSIRANVPSQPALSPWKCVILLLLIIIASFSPLQSLLALCREASCFVTPTSLVNTGLSPFGMCVFEYCNRFNQICVAEHPLG